MELRKEKHIKEFIEEVDRQWQLNLNEQEFLDSAFNLILQGDAVKVANIVNLYYEENYEELLKLIPNMDVEYYAMRHLDLVEDEDCEDEKTLEDFDDDEIIEEYFDRVDGKYKNNSIITDLNVEEMNNLFLSFTPQKQLEIIELLKTL